MGNKSIYRKIIAIPIGLKVFGEDKEIDRLIRKYGYAATPEVLEFVEKNNELNNNLGTAAHLIQDSSENRFITTYHPENLIQEEI